jgi:hypothetical protein
MVHDKDLPFLGEATSSPLSGPSRENLGPCANLKWGLIVPKKNQINYIMCNPRIFMMTWILILDTTYLHLLEFLNAGANGLQGGK